MKQKQLFIIIVLIFIFVLVWVAGNIYHNLNKSTISQHTSQDILPIDPFFNIGVIDNLRKREKITPAFELENLPTSVPTKIPTSSPSSSLTSRESSTQGGRITP
ncbi:MAG: hypothetical protein AAB583_01540 [Patescibacteria group bacterium]